MDVIAFVIGVIIGIVGVGLALELGMKKTNKTQPASRPTHKWNLSEISNPRIIAEHMGDMDIPKNAKVVVGAFDNKEVFDGMEVKTHSGIKGNFVLGDDRALVLSGPMKQDSLGVWTVEKVMLDKLNKYFEDSWSKASRLNQEESKK